MYGIWFVWGVDCILLPEAGSEQGAALFPLHPFGDTFQVGVLGNHAMLSALLTTIVNVMPCSSNDYGRNSEGVGVTELKNPFNNIMYIQFLHGRATSGDVVYCRSAVYIHV